MVRGERGSPEEVVARQLGSTISDWVCLLVRVQGSREAPFSLVAPLIGKQKLQSW